MQSKTALRDTRIAAFDEMNAPFPVDANALIKSETESTNGLRAALNRNATFRNTSAKDAMEFQKRPRLAGFPRRNLPRTLAGRHNFRREWLCESLLCFSARRNVRGLAMELIPNKNFRRGTPDKTSKPAAHSVLSHSHLFREAKREAKRETKRESAGVFILAA